MTKENTDFKGRLCLYKGIPVLVLKKYSINIDLFIYTEENTSYEVLFPQGGIDTVNIKSLKLIS